MSTYYSTALQSITDRSINQNTNGNRPYYKTDIFIHNITEQHEQ